jgi:signal transduction histidine kinase
LTNIIKHAYPEHVKIKVTRKDQQAVFVIEDDGRGFPMDKVLEGDKRGMGLAAMAQRVRLAGGGFDLWSRENQGARITFSIPFNPAGENK